jgi:hypothetical protein
MTNDKITLDKLKEDQQELLVSKYEDIRDGLKHLCDRVGSPYKEKYEEAREIFWKTYLNAIKTT